MVETLDIAPFFAEDPAARRRVVAQAEQALHTLGCLTITGHGVPDAVITEADRRWRGFFDAPLAYKRAHMPADPSAFRGYYPATALDTTQGLDQPRPPDLREAVMATAPSRCRQRTGTGSARRRGTSRTPTSGPTATPGCARRPRPTTAR